MRAIMMSIKPKWVEKIASGEKTVEVRKYVPKCGTPFKVYMYCTKEGKTFIHGGIQEKQVLYKNPESGNIKFDYPFELFGLAFGNDNILSGKVVGEFVCDDVIDFLRYGMGVAVCKIEIGKVCFLDNPIRVIKETCLSPSEIEDYLGDKDGYGLHISDLKIYDKPKELSEFWVPCIKDCKKCSRYVDKGGFGICHQLLERPPQSWCYVEGK